MNSVSRSSSTRMQNLGRLAKLVRYSMNVSLVVLVSRITSRDIKRETWRVRRERSMIWDMRL